MRAEIKEKQGLLCEAAVALDQMELSQKKCKDDSLATIEQLNQKIEYLEVRILESHIERLATLTNMIYMYLVQMEIKAIDKFADNDNHLLNRRLSQLEHLGNQYEQSAKNAEADARRAEVLLAEKDAMIKDSEKRCSEMAYELAELKEQMLVKDRTVKDLEVSNTEIRNYLFKKLIIYST